MTMHQAFRPVAALFLAVAGVAIYVQTDYGHIVVELSDPAAKVDG